MIKTILVTLGILFFTAAFGQKEITHADSLKRQGLLMPALLIYAESMIKNPSSDISYKLASTSALLWTSQMRDTAFYFLNAALQKDSTLAVLYNPDFLSLIEDTRWKNIEDAQIRKYEAKYEAIRNVEFTKELFRMIIKDQGFMYFGNLERRKYIENGGYFSSPSIFPILALEEENMKENEKRLLGLLDQYGWPTASEVTEYAAAGAALIINHSSYHLRVKYFPLLEEAFKKGEAQALRYAKMKDRILIEEGKQQLYGTQIKFENLLREPYPIKDPKQVDIRRNEIGLGPLAPYLKRRFDIDWQVNQD